MIVTFYNNKIDKVVLEYQKKVFNYFNLSILQICPEKWGTHGSVIDDYIKSLGEDWEYLVIFDVDCIPLTSTIVPQSINWVKSNTGIIGVAQNANHIKNSIIYAGPAFLAFSKKTYGILDRPSFCGNERSDNGGELTHMCLKKGYPINLLYPTSVEVPKWKLTDSIMFGLGTTFNNEIFHNFESRNGRNLGFIEKCKSIINEK